MKSYVGDVNRRRSYVLEFLLELEKAILDLLLDILGQAFLRADQFGIVRVATLLHDSAA